MNDMRPLMNNTKWAEVREAMSGLPAPHPKWRTKTLKSGYLSNWDGEWFYHFPAGGYDDIEWVEIQVASDERRCKVRNELRRIHVPGHETESGFKVYGYADSQQSIDYL